MRQTAAMEPPETPAKLAACLDHTLLKPDAQSAAIEQLCAEARAHSLWSVCINPSWISLARRALVGSEVRICTVIGFPLGANDTLVKAHEAERAVAEGADELDMVLAIGRLLDGEHARVRADVAAVVGAAQGRLVKVILETALLDRPMIERACRIAVEAGAGFVKTSTGFGPGGATIDALRWMRATVGPEIGVKASGGIRDAATARVMIEAGANRIGTSASLAILAGWPG